MVAGNPPARRRLTPALRRRIFLSGGPRPRSPIRQAVSLERSFPGCGKVGPRYHNIGL